MTGKADIQNEFFLLAILRFGVEDFVPSHEYVMFRASVYPDYPHNTTIPLLSYSWFLNRRADIVQERELRGVHL